jgi:hypothetical protein
LEGTDRRLGETIRIITLTNGLEDVTTTWEKNGFSSLFTQSERRSERKSELVRERELATVRDREAVEERK